jgi:hypothetical protein
LKKYKRIQQLSQDEIDKINRIFGYIGDDDLFYGDMSRDFERKVMKRQSALNFLLKMVRRGFVRIDVRDNDLVFTDFQNNDCFTSANASSQNKKEKKYVSK